MFSLEGVATSSDVTGTTPPVFPLRGLETTAGWRTSVLCRLLTACAVSSRPVGVPGSTAGGWPSLTGDERKMVGILSPLMLETAWFRAASLDASSGSSLMMIWRDTILLESIVSVDTVLGVAVGVAVEGGLL